MPSTWLQKARRLPCLALTLALCVALLSACLPLCLCACARALAICPEMLACCTSLDCAAPCCGAGTPLLALLAAEARTSATTADLHPASALLAAFVLSSGVKSAYRAASVARACRAWGGKPLSPSKGSLMVALRSARRTSRACAAGGISGLEISSCTIFRVVEQGILFRTVAHRLISNQGYFHVLALRTSYEYHKYAVACLYWTNDPSPSVALKGMFFTYIYICMLACNPVV